MDSIDDKIIFKTKKYLPIIEILYSIFLISLVVMIIVQFFIKPVYLLILILPLAILILIIPALAAGADEIIITYNRIISHSYIFNNETILNKNDIESIRLRGNTIEFLLKNNQKETFNIGVSNLFKRKKIFENVRSSIFSPKWKKSNHIRNRLLH